MSYVREPTYEVSFLFRKVLVPLDGSTSGMKALDIAIDFAKRYGSKITVLIVDDGSISNVEEVSEKVSERSNKAGVDVKVKVAKLDPTMHSTASRIIEESIEEDYDLIILSARGRTVNPDLMLGSVALSTIINTTTSVLLIR